MNSSSGIIAARHLRLHFRHSLVSEPAENQRSMTRFGAEEISTATYWGLLKQPDNQKPPREDLILERSNLIESHWSNHWLTLNQLNGKTALIIGMGGIGTQIAQRAHAFGMVVYGVDPKDISLTYFVKSVHPPDQLRELLPKADVIFISTPHTPESEKMIGPEEFRLMKQGAYFIVVSRGKTYDGNALVKALDEKHLAGAGLDVTDPEPLPKGHPLWKFENVVITPHLAGTSDGLRGRQMNVFKENVRRFSENKPLIHVVDKQKGY